MSKAEIFNADGMSELAQVRYAEVLSIETMTVVLPSRELTQKEIDYLRTRFGVVVEKSYMNGMMVYCITREEKINA